MEDAVENMALFRRFVLNIVKQSNCGARSQRNKLKEPAGMTTIGLSYSLVKISTKCAPAPCRWLARGPAPLVILVVWLIRGTPCWCSCF